MKRRVFGFVLVIISIVLTLFNSTITGAVIGSNLSNYSNFFASLCFVVGLILMSNGGKRNIAEEMLKQRRYVDNTRELKGIARKMGYILVDGYKEGTRVCRGDEVITVIPNHRKVSGRGTIVSILEALSTGESSFRRGTA